MAKDTTTDQGSDDLAARATVYIEHLVDFIRDRSVRPLRSVVRMLVRSVVTGLVGLVFVTTITIGFVRLLDQDAFAGRTWITDLTVGGMFMLSGALLIRRGTMLRRRHD